MRFQIQKQVLVANVWAPWGHLISAAREKAVEHVVIRCSSGKVLYVFGFKTILVVPFLSEKVAKTRVLTAVSTVLGLS